MTLTTWSVLRYTHAYLQDPTHRFRKAYTSFPAGLRAVHREWVTVQQTWQHYVKSLEEHTHTHTQGGVWWWGWCESLPAIIYSDLNISALIKRWLKCSETIPSCLLLTNTLHSEHFSVYTHQHAVCTQWPLTFINYCELCLIWSAAVHKSLISIRSNS